MSDDRPESAKRDKTWGSKTEEFCNAPPECRLTDPTPTGSVTAEEMQRYKLCIWEDCDQSPLYCEAHSHELVDPLNLLPTHKEENENSARFAQDQAARIEHLKQQRDRLRVLLRKHGSHTDQCNTIMGWGEDCPCDCGLDAALAEGE